MLKVSASSKFLTRKSEFSFVDSIFLVKEFVNGLRRKLKATL